MSDQMKQDMENLAIHDDLITSLITLKIILEENNVIPANPFVLLATRFAYYSVRIIKPFYFFVKIFSNNHIFFKYH